MKRCPQCEFIYEDDQSLCDMDGALLVFDSRTLPNLHALAPVDMPAVPVVAKAHWRHRTFPAMAALILATLFSLVYFVSSQRGAAPSVPPVGMPSVTLPASNLVAAPEANPTPEPPPAAEENSAAPASKVIESLVMTISAKALPRVVVERLKRGVGPTSHRLWNATLCAETVLCAMAGPKNRAFNWPVDLVQNRRHNSAMPLTSCWEFQTRTSRGPRTCS